MKITNGEKINDCFLIDSSQNAKTSSGSDYLRLTLTHKNISLPAMIWDATAQNIEECQAGRVMQIQGMINEYRNQLQIKINNFMVLDDLSAKNKLDELLPTAPMKVEDIKAGIQNYLESIANPVWHQIDYYLLSKFPQFYDFPAAKSNHHAYLHGLAFHTLSILREEKSLVDQYQQSSAAKINTDLLYAGTLIHDLGKVAEYNGAVGTDFTKTGRLLGHISIVDGWIIQAATELNFPVNSSDVIYLRHMVLSHHGRLEWGSPVQPQIIEAEILHRCDANDAEIETMRFHLNQAKENDQTETGKIFGMGNRNFYATD